MDTSSSQTARQSTEHEDPSTIRDPMAVPIKRALISVTNKTGLAPFAEYLQKNGVEIISTGGTAKELQETGIKVTEIEKYTGFPEIMNGRIKTLHPRIHGGILGKRDDLPHKKAMEEHDIAGIDLVIVNLYAFTDTVAEGRDFEECIENIDIGGPALIRAAAKNHHYVTVVTDPQDYAKVIEDMKAHDGATTYALRKKLAANAFSLTATYDSNIASWFTSQIDEITFPRRISFSGNWKQTLRYGENPHQGAALYLDGNDKTAGVVTAKQLQGKELSYNNISDMDAALELVSEFKEPAVAIIKHANPCGVAIGSNILDAYQKAFSCDTTSAFGGIIALNQTLDKETAAAIIKVFCEVIIAPSVEADAIPLLAEKEKIRVLTTGGLPDPARHRRMVKIVSGGMLVQDMDNGIIDENDLKIVSEREPTDKEMEDMLFAFKVAKHVKSNAIVYAKDLQTVGIGAGQMSRIDSARLAIQKAEETAREAGLDASPVKGAVVASDAFFPFADGLISAAEAGATAVIQPGGSIRDDDVIKAADDRGLAMVFTGMRHFKH